MKSIVNFWNKRSNYEKTILGLLLAFCVLCLGYSSGRVYYGSKCAVCSQTLRTGAYYILDVRTGEIQSISDYIEKESDVLWLSRVSGLPQEVSVSRGLSCMRFPLEAPATARYCTGHTAGLDSDFLLLSPTKTATVCYAILDGQNLTPDNRIMLKRLNEALGCWELEIRWDGITSVSSS